MRRKPKDRDPGRTAQQAAEAAAAAADKAAAAATQAVAAAGAAEEKLDASEVMAEEVFAVVSQLRGAAERLETVLIQIRSSKKEAS